jgi:hypothetical protein
MIERLHASLRALGQLSPNELEAAGSESLRRDCADALRLELDCRQLELGVSEREVLERLSAPLETPGRSGAELAVATRDASAVLGSGSRDRAT